MSNDRYKPVYSGNQQVGWSDSKTGAYYNLDKSVVLIPVDKSLVRFAEQRALEQIALAG